MSVHRNLVELLHNATKEPAAGGGAAGSSERVEQQLGGGLLLSNAKSHGRRVGPSRNAALREEV